MNFVVIGCGRFGAELAYRLFQNGYQVVVVDYAASAFNRLHPDFRGRTVEGDSLAADTLMRASLDKADGVAVATNSDIMNAVIGHAIRSHYPNVQNVILRNYDPAMRDMLEAFGMQIVSSTSWGAERMQGLLIDPSFHPIFSAGNGEVSVYEMYIPEKWEALTISDLLSGCAEVRCVALTRAGRAELSAPETKLLEGDVLTVSATLEGVNALRAKLQEGKEEA